MALFKLTKQDRDYYALQDLIKPKEEQQEERAGIGTKPSKQEQDEEGLFSSFFGGLFDRSEKRAQEIAKEARESALAARLTRELSGITRSLTEEDIAIRSAARDPRYGNQLPEETTLVDVTDTEEGKLTNVKPLYDLSEAIRTTDIDVSDLDTVVRRNTSAGKGLMSPSTEEAPEIDTTSTERSESIMSTRLDKGDEILPPPSVFIKNKGTTAGDAERKLYKDAYQAGLSGDELKSFMAQVAHESSSFGRIEERGYSWSRNYNAMPQAWKDRLKRDGVTEQNATSARIFNSVYANKNGNGDYASGDGNRYRGRGYIQLTGKDNYRTIGNDIGEDLVGNPDLMLNPDIARKASIAWWKRNVRGNVPDDDYTNINAVSGLVNRGSATLRASGLSDRKKKFDRYTEAVTNRATSPRPMLRPADFKVASN